MFGILFDLIVAFLYSFIFIGAFHVVARYQSTSQTALTHIWFIMEMYERVFYTVYGFNRFDQFDFPSAVFVWQR